MPEDGGRNIHGRRPQQSKPTTNPQKTANSAVHALMSPESPPTWTLFHVKHAQLIRRMERDLEGIPTPKGAIFARSIRLEYTASQCVCLR